MCNQTEAYKEAARGYPYSADDLAIPRRDTMTLHDRSSEADPITELSIGYRRKSGKTELIRITDPDIVSDKLEWCRSSMDEDGESHYYNGKFYPFVLNLLCMFPSSLQHIQSESKGHSPDYLAGTVDNQAIVDEDMTPAAMDLRGVLESLARSWVKQNRVFNQKELVTALARIYANNRLRKKHREP